MRVTCATYNIHFGVGQDDVHDLERIVGAVADADILCLQEVGRNWTADRRVDQAAEIAEALNHYFVYGAGLDIDAGEAAENGRVVNRRRAFGNMVTSRWPIRSTRTHLLPKPALPDSFDLQRCAVEAVVEVPGAPLRVYSVHLSHVSTAQRVPQVEALLDFVRRAPDEGRAWDGSHDMLARQGLDRIDMPSRALIMGDMNFTPADPEYAMICGEEGPVYGRRARYDQFPDAWTLAGRGEDEGDSFIERYRPGFRIDHAFVSHDLAPAVRRAWIDDSAVGSDHFPLFVEFAFED